MLAKNQLLALQHVLFESSCEKVTSSRFLSKSNDQLEDVEMHITPATTGWVRCKCQSRVLGIATINLHHYDSSSCPLSLTTESVVHVALHPDNKT